MGNVYCVKGNPDGELFTHDELMLAICDESSEFYGAIAFDDFESVTE